MADILAQDILCNQTEDWCVVSRGQYQRKRLCFRKELSASREVLATCKLRFREEPAWRTVVLAGMQKYMSVLFQKGLNLHGRLAWRLY